MHDLTEHGVSVRHSRLGDTAAAYLEILLRNWICCVETYNDFQRKPGKLATDVAYNYFEQPQVSVLAGAAWRTGYVALQDYDTKRNGTQRGKADLYIATETIEFVCEAKVVWVDPSQEHDSGWADVVEGKHVSAIKQLKALKDESCPMLSLVFVCPRIAVVTGEPQSEALKRIETSRRQTVQHCRDKFDALAWVFPKRDRLFSDTNDQGEERYYPGCILTIKKLAAPQ